MIALKTTIDAVSCYALSKVSGRIKEVAGDAFLGLNTTVVLTPGMLA